jgi:hypothetical protein
MVSANERMVNANSRPNDEFPRDPYWPFPTKDNPLKTWTPKEVKAYNQLQRAKAPDAPM